MTATAITAQTAKIIRTVTVSLISSGRAKSQRVRGCEPEGLRQHFLSKSGFSLFQEGVRRQKGF